MYRIERNTKIIFLFLSLPFINNSFGQCGDRYQKLWGIDPSTSITVTSAAYTPTQDLLVCGKVNSKAFVAKFNGTQSVQWSKTYSVGTSSFARKIISMSDGGVTIAGGYTENGITSILVIRLDAGGNLLWTKRLHDISAVSPLTNKGLLIYGLGETPDGGIAVCGSKNYLQPDGSYVYRIFVFKLGPSGTIDWTREDTNGNTDESFGLVIDQGLIVIVGYTYYIQAGIEFGLLEKLDPISGAIQFIKFYKLANITETLFRCIEKLPNGYEIGTQAFSINGTVYNVLQTDRFGNQLECKKFGDIGINLFNPYYYPVPMANGSSIVWKDEYSTLYKAQLYNITANRTAGWAFEYSHPGNQQIFKVLANSDNTALAVGTSPDPAFPSGASEILLIKTGQDGTTGGCVNNNLPFTIKDSLNFQVSTGNMQSTLLNFDTPFSATAIVQNVVLNSSSLCSSNTCSIDTIFIKGDSVICNPALPVIYKTSMSGSCGPLPVGWTMSPSLGNITTINDSTISIQFNTSGSTVLKAKINSICANDSTRFNIRYTPFPANINLGADTAICKGDTLHLSVSNSFNYILWNTHATVNIIPAYSAGIYSVSVSNDSICFLRDSINLQINPLPVVKLNKDSLICTPGSLKLSPGNGFKSYLWQDGSSAPTFDANTLGLYWVKVTDSNTCMASDSMHIIKLSPRPAEYVLFEDTAVCMGESVVLKLMNTFVQYNWNNGMANTPIYTIYKPGLYTIRVTDKMGCMGNDSVQVRNKLCTKAIYLPNAFTPNSDNRNDIFKPTVFGILDYFELIIYNRYGELVFRSVDVTKGWDGLYKNKLQNTGSFIWTIKYRFEGKTTIEFEKGTVLLLR